VPRGVQDHGGSGRYPLVGAAAADTTPIDQGALARHHGAGGSVIAVSAGNPPSGSRFLSSSSSGSVQRLSRICPVSVKTVRANKMS
jgi:hypothetical protein